MEMGGEVLKNLQSGMSYYSVPKSTLAFEQLSTFI